MIDFQLRLFQGNIFKELVKALLEKSNYTAIPYGYENPYSNVKKRLPKKLEDCSETTLRIRTSPDLLVFDEEENDVKLVEVKMCSYKTPQIKRIALYQKYWNEAIILFVVPFDNVFYAQEIDKLGKKEYYDLKSDFKPIQEIFRRTESVDFEEYKRLGIHLIQAMKTNGTEVKGNVES
jgi:hypothetical protein